jgi:hypothetical protein
MGLLASGFLPAAREDDLASTMRGHFAADGRCGYECYPVSVAGTHRASRRRFLALAGGALLAVSGGVAVVRTRGYSVPAEVASKLEALTPWQYVVVQHLARRIAAPDRDDGSVVTPDQVDVAGFVDAYVARLPAPLERDLLRALAFVEHLAPLAVGCPSRFTRLSPADQDRVLASLESNAQDLLRGAFDGLKSLVFMGYYRDPRTWKVLSYDGPIVNRPEAGWWR